MVESQDVAPPRRLEDEPDLLEYLALLLKRKKMIVSVTVAAGVLSAIVAFLLPKTYESTARILPPQQEAGLMAMMMGQMGGGSGLAGLAGGLLGTSTPADMYATVLDSEDIKDKIIDRFKLMEVYDKDERVSMYKKLDKLVQIKAGKKDGVISISVEDEDPRRAAAIAGAYIDELAGQVAAMGVIGAGVNRTFLEKRLARAKGDLARAEENLKAFQSRSKAIDVPEQAKASIEGIALLQAQLVAQESQLAAVRSRFTDSTQEVADIRASIANVKRKLAEMEGKGGGSSIIPAGSLPQLGEEYVRVMREFKIQESLVELLTKQYELAKLTEARDVANIQVIQKPHVPDKKAKPKRILIVLGGTLLACACSVLWVLLRDFLDKLPEQEKSRVRSILPIC